jgi:anti-sigma factor RsiW
MTHVTDRLQRYVDGELLSTDAREVEAHLRACDACRDECASLGALWQAVDAAELPAPAAVVWPALAARRAGGRRAAPLPWLRGGLAAAALVAGLVLGLGLDRTSESETTGGTLAVDDETGYLQTMTTLDQIWWSAGLPDDVEVGS